MNKSGVVTTEEETKKMINQIDMNNNGMVDYTEFLASSLKSKIYL